MIGIDVRRLCVNPGRVLDADSESEVESEELEEEDDNEARCGKSEAEKKIQPWQLSVNEIVKYVGGEEELKEKADPSGDKRIRSKKKVTHKKKKSMLQQQKEAMDSKPAESGETKTLSAKDAKLQAEAAKRPKPNIPPEVMRRMVESLEATCKRLGSVITDRIKEEGDPDPEI